MFTIDVTRSNGRWRMRRAVNDSPAGVPILLQVFYSSMTATLAALYMFLLVM